MFGMVSYVFMLVFYFLFTFLNKILYYGNNILEYVRSGV